MPSYLSFPFARYCYLDTRRTRLSLSVTNTAEVNVALTSIFDLLAALKQRWQIV